MPLLSVLILGIVGRHGSLSILLSDLTKQIKKYHLETKVEILLDFDNRKKTIAEKRNFLLEKASGKMVVYIDDDDSINERYLKTITDVIKLITPDYIGYKVKTTINGVFERPTFHSIAFPKVWEDGDGYYRHISHINPVKASIAKQFKFPDNRFGEDGEWNEMIWNSKLVKMEVYVDEFMYYYNYNTTTTMASKDTQAEHALSQPYKEKMVDFDRKLIKFVNWEI